MKTIHIETTINGIKYAFDVPARLLLVDLIRDEASLTGTHVGCDTGNCGACTIVYNGMSVKSCQMLAPRADGATIRTIEGLRTPEGLDPIQEAFWECDAAECGFCTAGMLMTAVTFLETHPDPTEEEIRNGFKGNLCRCTGYLNIMKAVQRAAELRRGGQSARPGEE
jgi:aerobic-type carbon monoxide dehydrogenase small subunit (CoxS/CutS family)